MSKELEKNIMDKINTGQVKPRSKYLFLAEKLGLGTAFALSVVLAALLFNLILFYMKETDNLHYLSFGKMGILAFLESFPYVLVIIFILFIVLAGYLTTKSDISYKKPFGYLASVLIVSVMFFGGMLTYTKIAESIEKGKHPFNRFLMKGSLEMREKGIAGIVFEKGEDYLIVETPHGLRSINSTEIKDDLAEVEKGEFVMAIGDNLEYDFVAQKIRILKEEDMMIVKKGIDERFNFLGKKLDEENIRTLPPQLMHFEENKKECIRNCLNLEYKSKKCFDDCMKIAR